MKQYQGNRLPTVPLGSVLQLGNSHPQSAAAMIAVDILQGDISDHFAVMEKNTRPYMPESLIPLDVVKSRIGLFHRIPQIQRLGWMLKVVFAISYKWRGNLPAPEYPKRRPCPQVA